MTGHAFQELLTDQETAAALAAVRRALVPGGVFAFETRNPAARAWESWNPGNAVQTRDRDGAPLTQAHEALPPDQEGLVSLTATFTGPSLATPRRYHGYLRFITADHLDAMLELAGWPWPTASATGSVHRSLPPVLRSSRWPALRDRPRAGAADGIHSRVRSAVFGPRYGLRSTGLTAWRGVVDPGLGPGGETWALYQSRWRVVRKSRRVVDR